MSFIFGIILVILSIIIDVVLNNGDIMVVMHLQEWGLIVAMLVGTFVISNDASVRKSVIVNLKKLTKDSPYKKEDYLELLLFLFIFFRHIKTSYAQTRSFKDIESHIDNPTESTIFKACPVLLNNQHATTFLCDYFRLITLGHSDVHDIDSMIESRLNEIRNYNQKPSNALLRLGDSLPGIGLIAAVLGMVMALGSVGEDAAILGLKVAGAMVGTFAGIFLSYGVCIPIANYLESYNETEMKFIECLHPAIISYLNGYAPSVCIEAARQIIPQNVQPSFYEVEDIIDKRLANPQTN